MEFLHPRPGAALGTILHIGAGFGGDLAAYLASGAERIILVEPDAAALAVLRPLVAGQDRVTLIPVAVTPEPGLTRLNRFNFADLNTLRQPVGITTIFPGLQVLSQDIVAVETPADLLARGLLSYMRPNWLVIEAPGEELAILTALDAAGQLEPFETLVLQGAREIYFAGSTAIDAVLDWLKSRHFTKDLVHLPLDPDRPHLRVSLDPLSKANDRLHHSLAQSQTALAQAQDQIAAAQTRMSAEHDAAEQGNAVLQSRLTEAEAARHAQKTSAEHQQARIQALEQQLAETEAARQGERTVAEAMRSENSKLTERLRELDHRQNLARSELRRSEGQIEMIKDLLLREDRL